MSKTYVFGKGTGATHPTGHKDVTISVDSDDATMADSALTQHVSLSAVMQSVVMPPYFYSDISLLRFDLSGIVEGETVQSATLRMVYSGDDPMAADSDVSVVQMANAWGVTDTTEGTDETPATGGQATYNSAKAEIIPTSWPGGDFLTPPYPFVEVPVATISVLAGHVSGQVYDVDLTDLVKAWVNGAPVPTANHGIALMVAAPAEDDSEWVELGSQDNLTESLRWTLTVVTDGEGDSPLVNGVWPRSKFVEQRQ